MVKQSDTLRRPPGRPRQGFFSKVEVSMESAWWRRLEEIAAARGLSRHAALRLAAQTGIEALER